MYLCVTIDGAQFEGPQEPSFEDVFEQQQFFDEGKWSLIILQSQQLYKYTHLLYMHVSRL
jgi:hypothetical protein